MNAPAGPSWEYRPAAKGSSWVITYHPGPKFFADQQARAARRQRATRIAPGARSLAPALPRPSEPQPPLLADILAVCGDVQNQAAYQKVLREYPEELLRMALAETRQAQQQGRIRKTRGAYFMDTLQRLTARRTALEPPPVSPQAVAAAPTRVGPQAAAQAERRALEAARQHTQAHVDAVLAALTPAQRQALEERATAQVTLRATELGYGVMLRFAREALVHQEHLGFDCWARLTAQLRAHEVTAASDPVWAACQLEAILEDVLVVSVPTAEAQAYLMARYGGVLADLASTPARRMQIRVLVR